MAKWIIQVDGGAGFTTRRYLDFNFDLPINDITTMHVIFTKSAAPIKGNGITLWRDLGGPGQRLWFRGTIENLTFDPSRGIYEAICYDPGLKLSKSTLGSASDHGLRDYAALTPHVILTQNPGPPLGLTYNGQANQVMPLASTAPNAIAAGNPGVALTFRAHTDFLADYVNGLCEQSVHDSGLGLIADAGSTAGTLKDAALTQADSYWVGATVTMTSGANNGLRRQVSSFVAATDTLTFYTAFPNAIAAGDTYNIVHYGLDWWCDYSGAGAEQLNVASNRQRALTYTPESLQIGVDIYLAHSTSDQDAVVDRVKVIGQGSGRSRIESAWVGAGSKEYVFADKNINDATAATNLANRIYNALSVAGNDRYTLMTYKHNLVTGLGDNISLVPKGGGAPSTHRCLRIQYWFSRRSFTLEVGRQRRFGQVGIRDLLRNTSALASTTQSTDFVIPSRYARGTPQGSVVYGPGAGTVIAGDTTGAGAITAVAFDGDVEAAFFKFTLVLDAAGAAHPGVVLIELQASFNGGPARVIASQSFGGNMRPTGAGAQAGTYVEEYSIPFKIDDFATGATNITTMQLLVHNKDAGALTITDNLVRCDFWFHPKHRLNEL